MPGNLLLLVVVVVDLYAWDAWMLGFRRTLKITVSTLSDVVTRVRLCGHHTRRRSRGEVHVYGAVMRRWGEGGDRCLFVCLFVVIKPENLYFAPCVWREVITPGNGCTRTQADHRAHSTRSGKQSEIVRSSHLEAFTW